MWRPALAVVGIAIGHLSFATHAWAGDAEASWSGWAQYLESPSQATLAPVVEAVRGCHSALPCRESLAPSSPQVSQLIRLIASGTDSAFEAGFAAKTTMPFAAGDLEDLYRALGELAQRDPAKLLRLTRAWGRDPDVLTMLPLETVDDFSAKDRLVAARIAALKRVTDSDLRAERDWSIAVLEGRTPSDVVVAVVETRSDLPGPGEADFSVSLAGTKLVTTLDMLNGLSRPRGRRLALLVRDGVPIGTLTEVLSMASKAGYSGDEVSIFLFPADRRTMQQISLVEFPSLSNLAFTTDPREIAETLKDR